MWTTSKSQGQDLNLLPLLPSPSVHSILTAGNGNTPTHTQKDIQPCETGCHGIENGNRMGTRTRTGR
ncbi:LOW QUALITY PROTEIN: uncharacterized protein LOC119549492 [Drosophila subpulchrella]|uniref:LOW QUALITY PROTEIN: uncharacterized protein LOC119549492 n=1 Tax=Drosophila subpulchrella TaxID=1486046 RepID=UPI0018A15080|nr:LOW QUALITY PROTEIN: uncharacterized protein LOC119549492 [Drosophila subpulchrella]